MIDIMMWMLEDYLLILKGGIHLMQNGKLTIAFWDLRLFITILSHE
jgi:hypothetical protein